MGRSLLFDNYLQIRMTLDAGTRLGRYEIRSELGAGGMGEVYLARDVEIGRDVALKVLPLTFSSDKDRLQRFQQEACAAGALNHPNILSIYDVGKHDGSPYVVSELLVGETPRPPADSTTEPVPWITFNVPAGPKPCPTELIDNVAIPLWASVDATANGLLFLLLANPCTKIATGQPFAGRVPAGINKLK